MITRNRSRKWNGWNNAVAESFFKTLKTEQIYGNKLISKETRAFAFKSFRHGLN